MTIKTGSRRLNVFRDTTVTSLIIGGVAAALSLTLAIAVRAVGYRVTLLSVGFVLGVILIDLWIVARFAGGRIAERLDLTDERLAATLSAAEQRLFERFNRTDGLLTLRGVTSAEFLKTQAEVMDYERVGVTKDVWIVSAGLNDEFKHEIIEVIMHNLKRGVRYVYVIPKDSVVIERVRRIKHACGDSEGVVWFHMPRNFFDLVPRHDISIYDPLGKTSEQIVAYMNLPVRSAPNNLFVILDGDYATGIFRSVIPAAKKARIIP